MQSLRGEQLTMGSPENLAILNAKTVKYDTGSGGGIPDLTWENMAGALGMCSAPAAMAARAILLHDPQSIRQLVGRLMGQTMRFDLGIEQRRSLVLRIVREEIHPDHCGTCGGRGEAMVGEVRVVCPTCSGSGRRNVGFAHNEEAPAGAVSATLSMWLSEALACVAREGDA